MAMDVLGRRGGVDAGPAARLGSYLARDGSAGGPVGIDLDGPHAACVVGKRGSGKSYTLGVLAEGIAAADGVGAVVLDPMGAFGGLTAAGGRVVAPRVRPTAIPPAAWPALVGLDPADAAGSLVWRAAERVRADAGEGDRTGRTAGIEGMRSLIAEGGATAAARRAADNHLALAAGWDVFDPDGPDPAALVGGGPAVVDLAGLAPAPTSAVCRAVARGLYDARIDGRLDRLPWLLCDEAHALFDGVAAPALRTLFTRGRAPGVTVVVATQRPTALPEVAVSQSDLLVAHRLTAAADVKALRAARPTYLDAGIAARLPAATGRALVVDDAAEAVRSITIRERETPHRGASPRAGGTSGASGPAPF